MCRASAAYQLAADARDKPKHDERGVGRLYQQLTERRSRPDILRRRVTGKARPKLCLSSPALQTAPSRDSVRRRRG
ncbi:hypothetical protein GFL49_08820 [Rhizobium leguminosarum bv. viciae]|nr:hypothetical protein [Rhizobium leguminosarum bv. viciae]